MWVEKVMKVYFNVQQEEKNNRRFLALTAERTKICGRKKLGTSKTGNKNDKARQIDM